MLSIRKIVGVALAVSLLMIFVMGFVAHDGRDFLLVTFGFAMGLFAVYLLEHLREVGARKGSRP
ncbi:MAG TPA: hypothetical protein GX702_13785 [Chloroflexi bacterium]|jgi:hypothetical protein|nr:hypothetical protein [Chloroflexota bacterium]